MTTPEIPDGARMSVNPDPLRVVPVRGPVPVGIHERVHRCRRCRMIRAFCDCVEGFDDDHARPRCPTCGGDRWIKPEGYPASLALAPCPECNDVSGEP